MYKGRLPKSAQMKEENPTTAVERSSAQIIKPPQKKKCPRKRRQQLKSRCVRRQPANTQLKVRGRRCTPQAFIYKRLPPQSQVSKLKTCYRSLKGARTPSKTADLGQSNSSVVPTDGKNFPRKEKVEHSEKPRGISNVQENQRRLKKANPVEKKRYQTVSEYQFICPGKAAFHCTRESVKQQLRSIYLGNTSQKLMKPHHPSARTPHCHRGINNGRRGNPTADTQCLVGSDFLRNTNPHILPHAISSLTYQINKLMLASPEGTAVNRYATHRQHQPALEKTTPREDVFQRLTSSPARQGGKEGWRVDLGYNLESHHQRSTRNALLSPEHCKNPPRLRPVSAKECYRKAWNHLFGGEETPNKEAPENEDAAESMPELSASSKAAIIQTQSAIIIPTVAQYSSNESLTTEGPRSKPIPFLTEMKPHRLLNASFSQAVPGEERAMENPTHHSSVERRQADYFTVPGSRRFGSLGMDAW